MTVSVPPSSMFDNEAPTSGRPRAERARATASDETAAEKVESTRLAWSERPRWQRWAIAFTALCAGIALVATPWWGPRALSRLDFFHVRTIEFEGVRFASTSDLVKRLAVDTAQSVWQPLDSLVTRLSVHPMVLRVNVVRDLPGTLRVVVTERTPVALVPNNGALQPADASGTLLPIDPAVTQLDVPIASSADSALLSVLDGLRQGDPTLFARVTQASRVSSGELRFTLDGGDVGAAGGPMVNALVVRTTPDVTIARFRDILFVEADLARNRLRAVEFDLRFRHQVIARQP
ncbi:MAG: FtsQ-type POTRA domain-containing protein [Gemmatimonadaceae bacterium]|nr:FtsQ-type POTRA domain-containing protein [Gemmatimonadaceae bacterium]